MLNKFHLRHARRKRTIMGLVFGGLLLFALVAGSYYITLQEERGLTAFDPAVSEDEEASEEDYEVIESEMEDLFEPAGEVSIDDKERKDEQRRSDLSEIHEALQQYYSEHGRYPTISQLNSDGFREANFPEAPREIFQDPADTGSRIVITRTPQAATYAYDAVDDEGYTCEPSGRSCASYTLSALLSSELTYSIDSDD